MLYDGRDLEYVNHVCDIMPPGMRRVNNMRRKFYRKLMSDVAGGAVDVVFYSLCLVRFYM